MVIEYPVLEGFRLFVEGSESMKRPRDFFFKGPEGCMTLEADDTRQSLSL